MQINYVDQLMRNELHFGLLFIYNEDIVRKDNNKIIVCIDDDNNISIADTKKPELIIYKPKLSGNYAEEILTQKKFNVIKIYGRNTNVYRVFSNKSYQDIFVLELPFEYSLKQKEIMLNNYLNNNGIEEYLANYEHNGYQLRK